MKKYLYLAFCAVGLLSFNRSIAQSTFTVASPSDTVVLAGNTTPPKFDDLTNTTGSDIYIKWKVTSSDFPSDWLPYLGICDNNQCHSNTYTTFGLWNGTTGGTFISLMAYHPSTPGGFDLQLSDSMGTKPSVSIGTHYVTVTITDTSNSLSHKDITFVVVKTATSGLPGIFKSQDDILLYPNPARDEVNIVYGPNAGVKTIAIYNLIGKIVSIFKPLDNSGAMLSIDNLPSGIYFVRLMDAQGAVIATRKFTHQ